MEKEYAPSSIISYCDLSKFDGGIYKSLGFKHNNTTVGKHWYNIKTHTHITDNHLRVHGVDRLLGTAYGKGTDNVQLMIDNNFLTVYDAGQASYIWRNT
jgi:hypothetical protein